MYYVVEISKGDSSIAGKAVYEYASKNEALANFHSKLGTAMKSPLYTEESIMVIDAYCSCHASEHYVADVIPEVEE